MSLVGTIEDVADPDGEFVSTERPLGLNDLAFAVDPLRLYGIEPRALRRQQAGHYPYSTFAAAAFDSAIVGGDPVSDQSRLVPGCVLPDKKQSLLAGRRKLLAAPPKK